jgi:hypothetical protein
MQIVDQTPYRTETGEIDIMGRVQGTLKFGLTWYDRVKAQDVVIGILDKALNNGFILLRNITLPNTEIMLPLILIGPPGIFLINVTHERGVYRARGDEWGTIAGDHFVPSRINQISRTLQMAKVLQVYLDRAGYKGTVAVEPILMAADPGMHIDSVRPALRVVMSDAQERFAVSMAQTHGTFAPDAAATLARVIVKGAPPKREAAAPTPTQPANAQPADDFGGRFNDALGQEEAGGAFAPADLGFAFTEDETDAQPFETQAPAAESASPRPAAPQKTAAPRKKGFLGLNKNQLLILGGLLLLWVCSIIGFAIYILLTWNA